MGSFLDTGGYETELVSQQGTPAKRRPSNMSTEQNKALSRRFSDLINAHDADGAFALCSPDFVDHAMPPGTPAGTEGSRQFFRAQFAAFPDLHGEIYDLTAEGDRVAFRVEVEGTHEGPLM